MLTLIDMFCGAGGSSTGALEVPGVELVAAANHWDLAIDTHAANHPGAEHICADISQYEPRLFPRAKLAWLSPSCTKHSIAQGVKQADKQPDLFGRRCRTRRPSGRGPPCGTSSGSPSTSSTRQ